MVAPLVAAAGIAAATAIAQAYNAEKARGANAKRMKELRSAFEKIVPPEYDISIDDAPKYLEQSLQAAKLDFSRITPEDYQVIGKYSPEAAEYVRESAPQLVQGTGAQREGRQAQIDALREFQKVARGESPEMRIKMQQAADQAQGEAQSRSQSALQDAQRRGMLGSGLSFAAALQGSSDAMATGARQSQNAALEAYRNKMNAIQQTGQMGRQLSEDELRQESANADIVNSFNERTSRNYQNYLNQRAQTQNDAQRFNLGREQDIANRNVAQRNDAQRYNLENRNRLAQQSYDNTRQERNYQNDLAYQKANWAAQQRQKQNDLKRQAYQDQLQRQGMMQGIAGMEIQQNNQSTADRNAAIGGIGGAAAGYYSQQSAMDAQKSAQDREDARWDKYYSARYGNRRADLDRDSYNSDYQYA